MQFVWDAAANSCETSLNSMLLKGSDILTSLLAVLCRFREHNVAMSADIKEMFHHDLPRLTYRSMILTMRL